MKGTIRLTNHPDRGLYRLSFPYKYGDDESDLLKDEIKRIPGTKYQGEGKWTAGVGTETALSFVAAEWNLDFECKARIKAWGKPKGKPHPTARPYQVEHSVRAIERGYYLMRFEMRLGKTFATVEALRRGSCNTALIVCPSIAKGVWREEIKDWWPNAPTTFVVKGKKQIDQLAAMADDDLPEIIICTYAMAQRDALLALKFDALVFDESQALKNPKTARSEAARQHVVSNPYALVIALTGTPIANQAIDLFGQFDVLTPDAWGTYYRWGDWFCSQVLNEHAPMGYTYGGLRDDRITELKDRMAPFVGDVTKADVKHLLPPLVTRNIYIDSDRRWTMQSLDDVFEDQHRIHEKRFDAAIAKSGNIKVPHAIQWVNDMLDEGVTMPCVLTHLNSTAKEIAKGLKKFDPLLLAGKAQSSADKRYSLLTQYRKRTTGVIVATMHSVGVAIDLTCCAAGLFAELYWDPLTMEQALSRFHGLKDRKGGIASNNGAAVDFLIAKGTLDEIMIAALRPKVDDILKLMKQGQADATLKAATTRQQKTQKQFAADMRSVAASMISDDDY